MRADEPVIGLWEEYRAAKEALSYASALERTLKAKLLIALGYDPDDPKPQPVTITDTEDNPVFSVAISMRRSLDTKYLKRTYPDIYAEAEKVTPAKSIKEALNDE